MVEITSHDEFDDWLDGQSQTVSIVMASRIALRVFPYFKEYVQHDLNQSVDFLLPLFRALSTSWFTGCWASRDVISTDTAIAATFTATNIATIVETIGAETVEVGIVDAATAAIAAAAATTTTTTMSTAAEVTAAATTAVDAVAHTADAVDFLEAISIDAIGLTNGMKQEALALEPLWLEATPDWFWDDWKIMKQTLLDLDTNWQVWTDWFDDRIYGDASPKSRRLIEDLELERVRIANDDWEKGPTHVNALIAEMEARHRAEVPEQRSASIEVEYGDDGILHRRPAPKPQGKDSVQDTRLLAAWFAHSEQLAGLEALDPGKNLPTFGRAMRDYRAALGGQFDEMNVIALGVHGTRLNSFSERADVLFLEEAASEVQALNANHGMFIRQFQEWNEYVKDSSPEPIAEIIDAAIGFAHSIENEPELFADDLRTPIAELADAVAADRSLIANPDDRLAHELLLVEGNVLSEMFKPLVEFARDGKSSARKGALSGIEAATKHAVAAITFAGTTYGLAKATGLSADFGWIVPIIDFLKMKFKL